MADINDVRIERVFDAPIVLVRAMWADEQRFANWYGELWSSSKTSGAEPD